MAFSKYTSLPQTVLAKCFVSSSLPLLSMVALCCLRLPQSRLPHTPSPADRTACSQRHIRDLLLSQSIQPEPGSHFCLCYQSPNETKLYQFL